MANDWYRKTTWNEADQADFFARLNKSRKLGCKAQYLRIQAAYLENSGVPEFINEAISLLNKMLLEFPSQQELAAAYSQKASCLAKLGDIDNAVVNYRQALETERNCPRVKTNAFKEFGQLVAENGLTQFFDEALIALESELASRSIQFPADTFSAFGIRSLIATQRGQTEKAKKFAKIAMEAAVKIHSGLRYHSNVGLVHDKGTMFYKSIQAIAQQLKFP